MCIRDSTHTVYSICHWIHRTSLQSIHSSIAHTSSVGRKYTSHTSRKGDLTQRSCLDFSVCNDCSHYTYQTCRNVHTHIDTRKYILHLKRTHSNCIAAIMHDKFIKTINYVYPLYIFYVLCLYSQPACLAQKSVRGVICYSSLKK